MSLGYVWRVKEKNLSIPFAEVSYFQDYRFLCRWDKIEKFYNEEFDPGSG